MAVSQAELRLALLKKAFISDWEGAAPVAASDKKCAPLLGTGMEALVGKPYQSWILSQNETLQFGLESMCIF